jgi:hypothetical protein
MAIRYDVSEVEQAYRHIKGIHKQVRDYTQTIITQISAGCLADRVIEIGRVYRNMLAEFAESEAVQGIGAHARAVEGDAAYDLIAEHGAIKTKMAAVQAHIFSTLPKQNGYLLVWQLNADFTTTIRALTGAQLAPLVLLMQDVIA